MVASQTMVVVVELTAGVVEIPVLLNGSIGFPNAGLSRVTVLC